MQKAGKKAETKLDVPEGTFFFKNDNNPIALNAAVKKIYRMDIKRTLLEEKMASIALKNSRMEFKTTLEVKRLLIDAALLEGIDLTAFVLEPAVSRAREVIAAHHQLLLSKNQQQRFFELLINPPAPSRELRALMQSESFKTR
ncbi:MAG: DUF1778 domain-containing protein [Pseudomonadota bacterium]